MTAVRAVRVITEVGALDRAFDYAIDLPETPWGIGDRVRVNLNNRSVRGWIVDEVEPERELKNITKWLGYGPPSTQLALLEWASERWCSPLSRFLISSSPKRLFTSLPQAPNAKTLNVNVSSHEIHPAPGVLEMSPTTDPLALILGAYEYCRTREGSLLVLVPNEAWAKRLRGRLEQRGCAVVSDDNEWDRMRAGWPVVVGSRGTALAPVPRVSGAVIVDCDDEAYRSEAAPTWDALSMLRERCRRDNAPLWATSYMPSPSLVKDNVVDKSLTTSSGWPLVTVVDRRISDPHDGVLSRATLDLAHQALEGKEHVAVAVVLQRLGNGRLFACRRCGELARCEQCALAEEEVGEFLSCRDRHEMRANFCRACGATNLKRVRVGVGSLAKDVAAQLSCAVSEITSASDLDAPMERVVVGTEAVWQRVRKCTLVVFVDFDQYLLAPRESSRRSAITAVAKAARLVGSRSEGRGRVVIQTRRGDDSVIHALTSGVVDEIVREDLETAQLLDLVPFVALATLSGPGAETFAQQLVDGRVKVRRNGDTYEVRAANNQILSEVLRATPRPSEKLRIAVF